jgi:hypothetical protein
VPAPPPRMMPSTVCGHERYGRGAGAAARTKRCNTSIRMGLTRGVGTGVCSSGRACCLRAARAISCLAHIQVVTPRSRQRLRRNSRKRLDRCQRRWVLRLQSLRTCHEYLQARAREVSARNAAPWPTVCSCHALTLDAARRPTTGAARRLAVLPAREPMPPRPAHRHQRSALCSR